MRESKRTMNEVEPLDVATAGQRNLEVKTVLKGLSDGRIAGGTQRMQEVRVDDEPLDLAEKWWAVGARDSRKAAGR